VEFLGLSLVLLVPLVYLVLVLGRVQAAAFAVEGASREAARTYTAAATIDDGAAQASTAVAVALADQGFADDPVQALTLECAPEGCLAPGADVRARVEVRVPLPFAPAVLRDVVPLEIPVSAEHAARVDEYREAG